MSIAHLLWELLARFGVLPHKLEVIHRFHDGMKACVWSDDGRCSVWFDVRQELCQKCWLSPLLFGVFFAGILLVSLDRFSKGADILADFAHLQEQPSKVGSETVLECQRRAILRMLYADYACIVSRSPRGLERMAAIFVEVFGALDPTISEQDRDHMHADSACTGNNADSLQNHRATVPPDNLLDPFWRHRH